jgi:CheY-like chemotaxis protein
MAKLMLVEDDNNLREIYEARLQAEGYTIVSAHDGEEALVVAKAEKPDLIISDVMMPKISGFEMLDILRNTDGLKDVKVIMLSALGQSDDQQRADHLGADRYLVKSQVTLEDIVKVAQELLTDSGAPANMPAAPAPEPVPEPPVVAAPEPVVTPPPAAPAPTPTPEPVVTAVPEPPVVAAPEPVVTPPPAAPAPTPAAVSLVASPVPNDKPANSSTSNEAVDDSAPQSEAKESAEVEAKIEDFVTGATEEAPSPNDDTSEPSIDGIPEPAITLPPEPVSADPTTTTVLEPAQQAQSNAEADDKLIKDAAQGLADAVPAQDAEDKAAGTPPQSASKTESGAAAESTEGHKSENVTIAHKLVIQPPTSAPKHDIEALLAEEEAKESGYTQASTPVVSSSDDSDDGKVDPHSIAL